MIQLDDTDLERIIKNVKTMDCEESYVEFKTSMVQHDKLAKTIVGIANALVREECNNEGYIIFGIDEKNKNRLVGTKFNENVALSAKDKTPLLMWLRKNIDGANFKMYSKKIEGVPIKILAISPAIGHPASFESKNGRRFYLRIGPSVKEIKHDSEEFREIFFKSGNIPFEIMASGESFDGSEVGQFIDYFLFYKALGKNIPSSFDEICSDLVNYKIIERKNLTDRYVATNIGLMFLSPDIAKIHNEFIERKMVRVNVYDGIDKMASKDKIVGRKGYLVGLEGLLATIVKNIPTINIINSNGTKEVIKSYSIDVLREAIVNSMVHQDFTIQGSSPSINIYDDRMIIENPGKSLISKNKVIMNNKTRNIFSAKLLRALRFCEEEGSGFDKIVEWCEKRYLPAPVFESCDECTRLTLFFNIKPTSSYNKKDKIDVVFYHCALKYLSGEVMTNETLRNRFPVGMLDTKDASKWIDLTVKEGLIVVNNPDSKKYRTYSPKL